MNLHEALKNTPGDEVSVTRPKLLAERGVYLLYQGAGRPMKQCWLGRPELTIDWTPSVSDLQADDWMFVSKEWVQLNAT